MAFLKIRTEIEQVFIIGDFCKWDASKAIVGKRHKHHKYITIKDMPGGFYRVMSDPSCRWWSNEIYPEQGFRVVVRRFAGDTPEVIRCFFRSNY